MAVEIERKFLVDMDKWNKSLKAIDDFTSKVITSPIRKKTIRVRIADEGGFITIKGKSVGAPPLHI